MPYESPIGNVYDSGDTRDARKHWRLRAIPSCCASSRGSTARALVGVGIASAVEPNTLNLSAYELMTGKNRYRRASEKVRWSAWRSDGTVRVALGNVPSGQGYETTVAQIVADELGLTPDDINVTTWFDSSYNPWLYCSGSFANKFAGTDTGAIVGAARTVRDKILRLASPLCGHAAADLTLREKGIWLRGGNEALMPIRSIANAAYRDLLRLPARGNAGSRSSALLCRPASRPAVRGTEAAFSASVFELRACRDDGSQPRHRSRKNSSLRDLS